MKKICKCPRCKYSWNYKGKLQKATCPNCSHKFFVEGNVEIIYDKPQK